MPLASPTRCVAPSPEERDVATAILMPRWGMIMEEGFIVSWLKGEGESIEKGDILAEVESEKVTNEIESPGSGILARIVIPEGESAKVGAVVAILASNDESEDDVEACIASHTSADTGNVAEDTHTIKPGTSEGTPANVSRFASGRIRISPAAKKIAEINHVRWREIRGSGPGGRIQVKDIKQAIDGQSNLPPLRRAIARRTTKSIEIPQAALCREIDLTRLIEERRRLKTLATEKEVPSLTASILHYVSRVLLRVPELNGTFQSGVYERASSVQLGVVVAIDGGVVVPIIRDAQEKSIEEIDRDLVSLVSRAGSGKLDEGDLTGSTFTVSNAGMLGIDLFQPLLNPPEVSGLGLGRIKRRPMVVGDEIVIRSTAFFCMTTDHRIIDAAPAGEFLTLFDELVSDGSVDG